MSKTDIKVRELVDKVQRGELALPEMQRRYVWPATRVRDLLDSLYRGYPSGTILAWETDENVQDRQLAVKPTQGPTTSQKLLLLDGQQRITSLTAILTGQPVYVRKRKKPIEILFNLDYPDGPPVNSSEIQEIVEPIDSEENDAELEDNDEDELIERGIQEEIRNRTFVVANSALQNNPVWVPVSRVFEKSDKEILKPLHINSDDERWDKYSARLQRLRQIAEYPYVMQVLEKNLSYEEVADIFVRVNSLGMKLRGSDLALAQISPRWNGFVELIEEFAHSFRDTEEYLLDTGLLIRALVVFATKQSRFKTIERVSHERAKLEEAWKSTQMGIEYARNFVLSNVGVDNFDHISSSFLLIPIAVYWVLKEGKSITPDEERKLLRWFYIAHMRGHYTLGSSETILDQDLSVLFGGRGLDGLLEQLRLQVKKIEVDSEDLKDRGIRSPFFSMLYFVLKQKGAKDWWSGLKLSEQHTGKSHIIQCHHIFPRALLRKNQFDKKEINDIANLAFIGGKTNRRISDKEPAQYFEQDIIPSRGKEALESQLIPMDKRLWKVENYKEFLEHRRDATAVAINEFMNQIPHLPCQ
jgi:hypothetical protein